MCAYPQIANPAAARERAEKELADRYGTGPEAMRNLLPHSTLKTLAGRIGIESIHRRHNLLNIKFHKEGRLDPSHLMDPISKTRGARLTPAGVLLLSMDASLPPAEVLRFG